MWYLHIHFVWDRGLLAWFAMVVAFRAGVS